MRGKRTSAYSGGGGGGVPDMRTNAANIGTTFRGRRGGGLPAKKTSAYAWTTLQTLGVHVWKLVLTCGLVEWGVGGIQVMNLVLTCDLAGWGGFR